MQVCGKVLTMLEGSRSRALGKKTVTSRVPVIFVATIDLAIKLSLAWIERPSGNKKSFCELPKVVVFCPELPDIYTHQKQTRS